MRRAAEQWLLTLHQVGAEVRTFERSSVTVPFMQADAPFWKALVFDGIDEVDVEQVATAFGTVEIVARGSKAGAACPDCGHHSERVHGSYQRRLRDLPLGERSVVGVLLCVALAGFP